MLTSCSDFKLVLCCGLAIFLIGIFGCCTTDIPSDLHCSAVGTCGNAAWSPDEDAELEVLPVCQSHLPLRADPWQLCLYSLYSVD